jgi:putative addiction module component (TIGR02574 family)
LGKIQIFLRLFPWYPALMSIDQIAPEAMRLPVSERALLAASLWESIGDPFELPGDYDDEAALNLAEERDQEIESGRVEAVSHQDLMQRLRQ